jgi:hypothetical protein
VLGRADDVQRLDRVAVLEADEVLPPVAPDADFHEFGQRVDDRRADAVQAARDLVGVLVELAAGVQAGQHDLGRADALLRVDVDRDAAPVIGDGDEPSPFSTTSQRVAKPACASSTALSMISKAMWCRPEPSSVSPMYMPGRLRTASSPRSTVMEALS